MIQQMQKATSSFTYTVKPRPNLHPAEAASNGMDLGPNGRNNLGHEKPARFNDSRNPESGEKPTSWWLRLMRDASRSDNKHRSKPTATPRGSHLDRADWANAVYMVHPWVETLQFSAAISWRRVIFKGLVGSAVIEMIISRVSYLNVIYRPVSSSTLEKNGNQRGESRNLITWLADEDVLFFVCV